VLGTPHQLFWQTYIELDRAKITDEEYLTHLEKNIYRIRQSQNANIWLGGNFNIGGIDWDTYSIKNKAQNTELRYFSETSIKTPPCASVLRSFL
jgi:hypothetical protein